VIVCDWHSYGCDSTHSGHVDFDSAGIYKTVAFKDFLWCILYNLIHAYRNGD
jgi:hypothetical protein